MFLSQYTSKGFSPQYKATIGLDFTVKEIVIDDHEIALQLWDSSGQERFRSINTALYRGSDCCILVFSINNRESFQNISRWKASFLEHCSSEEPSFVLVGNKNDLEAHREVTSEEAGRWCMENNCIPYFECSAMESSDIEIIVREMAERLVKKKNIEDAKQKVFISVNNTEEIQLRERSDSESSSARLSVGEVDLRAANDGECSWMKLLDKVFYAMKSGESQFAELVEEINTCAEEYPNIRDLQHVKKFLLENSQ